MKCVDVFHALHKCWYPGCLGQAATAWVISPFAYNLLQSLMRRDSDDKYAKINDTLKAKQICKSITAVFHLPSMNVEEKLKSLSLQNVNVKKVDFTKEQAGNIISEWANQHEGFKQFTLEKSIPPDVQCVVVNISVFKIMELPTQDTDFRVIVLVPSQVDLLHTLFRRLTNEGLAACFASVQPLFSVESLLTPPDIAITSSTNIELEEGADSVVQYGMTEINSSGIQTKVLSCLYSTKMATPSPAKVKPQTEKAPYLFAITFKDTPIFTGQYMPKT